ncbi:MAG: dihydroorotase, partial [Limnobacter sp.]|nr:dihydroorotase [Limnobacter sp.]
HLHFRDGDTLDYVVPATALQFARAIVMPNLKPPVTTVEQALAYRSRITQALHSALESGQYSGEQVQRMEKFQPLMTLYLTGATVASEIEKACETESVHAVKFYPAGATTNSDAGVHDLLAQSPKVLAAMQESGVPLLVHGEVTDTHVDIFDREAQFIEQVMKPLREKYPSLRVVFEHITTRQAAEFVASHSERNAQGQLLLGATLTPQHLLYNRNAIFKGGLQPHWFCLPILKREEHRQALIKAATSGAPQFFLGTDSAPHAKHLKEMSCGCAGCYSAPYALEMYAQAFESMDALEHLQAFASENGPAFYGLPKNEDKVILVKKVQTIPGSLPFSSPEGIVPFRAGEELSWSLQGR